VLHSKIFTYFYAILTFLCFNIQTTKIWENQNIGLKDGQICRVTVDGTNFGIEEPTPFSAMWFSHKRIHAGLIYEIRITIQTGDLVWINGPYPCGDWPDVRIARNGICDELDPGQKIFGRWWVPRRESVGSNPKWTKRP
jgi:hypothetical protein